MSDASSKPVAIVTGGSRGIGKACVSALAEDGYQVAFSYVSNAAAAEEMATAVSQKTGNEVLAIKADAGDVTQAQALIDQVHQKFGRLDVLVNNAGITRDGLLVRMSDEDWDKVLQTNLTGAFYTTRAAGKIMMKQRSGCIINIASIVGVYGNAGQTNYAASKAGLIGMTKSVAKELGARGVRANVIAPGFIETDMTHDLPTDKIKEHIPLARLGQGEDIAKTVCFLATHGTYITGQVIHVDGGLIL